MEKILFPFGACDVQTPAYAAIQSVEVYDNMTVLNLGTITADTTVNLVLDGELRAGARLLVKVKATANADDVTFGNNIDAPVIVGVAGKTKTQEFVFDGTLFVPAGAVVQID